MQIALLTTCHLDAKIRFQSFLHCSSFQVAFLRSPQISASAILSPATKLILLITAITQRSWNSGSSTPCCWNTHPSLHLGYYWCYKSTYHLETWAPAKRASMQDLKCVPFRLKGCCLDSFCYSMACQRRGCKVISPYRFSCWQLSWRNQALLVCYLLLFTRIPDLIYIGIIFLLREGFLNEGKKTNQNSSLQIWSSWVFWGVFFKPFIK